MTEDKIQYIGKRLTWDEAVAIFPNLWVSFKDCIYHGVDFQSGTLIAVNTFVIILKRIRI